MPVSILEEPMSALKYGITFGGSFVIQHQEKETMAAVLLAREGEYAKKNEFSFTRVVIITRLWCASGERVSVPVR